MSNVLDAPSLGNAMITLDEIDAATENLTQTIARMRTTIANLQAENERLQQAQLAPPSAPNTSLGSIALAPLGITSEMAASIRASFANFAEEWNAPGMEDYDDYENVIATIRPQQAQAEATDGDV